ncbi:hypothetical protein CEK25_011303 [Fusarium fujikuroi]|nr:hypothetical protein CEK25_011303 [Fusarium fujikuroi]
MLRLPRNQLETFNRPDQYVGHVAHTTEAIRLDSKSPVQAIQRDQRFETVNRFNKYGEAYMKKPRLYPHKVVVTLGQDERTDNQFDLVENYEAEANLKNPPEAAHSGTRRFLRDSP